MTVKLTILLMALAPFVMAQATQTQPDIVPEGWVHDYDDSSSLRDYLADQAKQAAQSGKPAYAYIYSDDNHYCRGLRSRLDKRNVADAFDSVRIVMLKHQFFNDLYAANADSNFDPDGWTPVILKISDDGMLTTPLIRPDVYLYHPNQISEWQLRARARKWHNNTLTMEQIFVTRMREYFEGKGFERRKTRKVRIEESEAEKRVPQH